MYISTATYCGIEWLLVAPQIAHAELSNTLTNFFFVLDALRGPQEELGICAPGAAVIVSLKKGNQKVAVSEPTVNAHSPHRTTQSLL